MIGSPNKLTQHKRHRGTWRPRTQIEVPGSGGKSQIIPALLSVAKWDNDVATGDSRGNIWLSNIKHRHDFDQAEQICNLSGSKCFLLSGPVVSLEFLSKWKLVAATSNQGIYLVDLETSTANKVLDCESNQSFQKTIAVDREREIALCKISDSKVALLDYITAQVLVRVQADDEILHLCSADQETGGFYLICSNSVWLLSLEGHKLTKVSLRGKISKSVK